MNKLLDIARNHEIIVVFLDISKPAFYISETNTIIINNNLLEGEQKIVLLHELAHAKKHRQQACLYNSTYVNQSKMEAEANEFMLHSLVEENDGAYNYTNVIEEFGLGIGEEEVFNSLNS